MTDFTSPAPALSPITLELPTTSATPEKSIVEQPEPEVSENQSAIAQMEATFSESELAQIDAFVEKIDITDSDVVLQYGSPAQRKVANFSNTTLERVRTRDLGDAGEMLTGLINELNDFSPDTEKIKSASIRKLRKMLLSMKTQYSKVSTNVDTIASSLEEHQLVLMQDLKVMDELYARNQLYFKELSMYILAGRKRLEQLRATRLAELRQIAESSNDALAIQQYNDFAAACDRFEKKLHDLNLSRTVALQMFPQIRMLQNTDTLLIDKIQSTIVNTIPLWKSQMVLALGIANSVKALRAQRSVTDMTNNLLRRNAESLKQGTIDVARESERGIIDIETLVKTNQDLIDTITEVQQIQANGRKQRRDAETQLQLLERDLKQKLLTT